MRISDWSSDVCSSDLRLCAGNASTIKGLLGLPASRIRANHPLKFCFLCLESDRRQSGVAYWHLTHQLPGVWICPAHNCFLLPSTHKATGVGRFLWYLHHNDDFYQPLNSSEPTRNRKSVGQGKI